jgi:hypothetical protein
MGRGGVRAQAAGEPGDEGEGTEEDGEELHASDGAARRPNCASRTRQFAVKSPGALHDPTLKEG